MKIKLYNQSYIQISYLACSMKKKIFIDFWNYKLSCFILDILLFNHAIRIKLFLNLRRENNV